MEFHVAPHPTNGTHMKTSIRLIVDIGWDEDELPCFSAPSNDDSAYNDDEDEDLPAFSPSPPNAWANDSWRLVLELKKSKLDIARAREFQRKQDVIAAARKQRLLTAASKTRTHAKLDKQTKKLVHEATRDAIEYHKVRRLPPDSSIPTSSPHIHQVLDTIERQTKTKNIQHMHEHELTTRFLRTGQRQKWHKGAWLGEGPFPSAAYVLPPPDTLPFVYDVHGRRHDAARAGDVTSQSLFDAVMTKIQREAAKAGKQLVAYFQRDEQMDVLFAWFDRNHTGGIDYGEVRRLIVPIHLSSLESLL
ncbi:hypothetical protein B5M09_003767 [Aphanomyces astaci]|uniref:EF-hand domain-containing protein n=1 Tax=Aphanomyces astaci TaxID=112090 RepID=A0A3R7WR53_APHAT|nr:hypothetical protein B5M09_003767 [Aphanomyces astaci]